MKNGKTKSQANLGQERSSAGAKSLARKSAPVKRVARAKPATAPARRSERKPAALDWRATTLEEVRRLIQEADPDMVEERKWIKPTNPFGVPVWSHAGIVCTGETYKQVVKLTFFRGAALEDPQGLFNASLEGNARRAIDIREGEMLNKQAFKALIQAAVAENVEASGAKTDAKKQPASNRAHAVKLLSGGNPQIAKAEGDAPVQAYIASMPGWKRAIGERLDALIVKRVPRLKKAVKWNSPFYGIEGRGWFLSFHCFARYVKVTFFQGASLQPAPTGGTSKDARWFDIHENEDLDEAQLTSWIKQAAALPGWSGGPSGK